MRHKVPPVPRSPVSGAVRAGHVPMRIGDSRGIQCGERMASLKAVLTAVAAAACRRKNGVAVGARVHKELALGIELGAQVDDFRLKHRADLGDKHLRTAPRPPLLQRRRLRLRRQLLAALSTALTLGVIRDVYAAACCCR